MDGDSVRDVGGDSVGDVGGDSVGDVGGDSVGDVGGDSVGDIWMELKGVSLVAAITQHQVAINPARGRSPQEYQAHQKNI
ncbi:hypothetical protein Pmani_030159 [Petrolisthes manimaculis]|uniref:Uncharacterized protein n=1 Tax=Petrolisthes manimaculis TaxID=1843537 RepID=A0AAE1NXV6_9EUCA|nr:hypothetical protein Pmani_030159 [Petrolisthes manimaculis]